jgi:hypothetical protein
MLHHILSFLNERGECVLPVDDANTLSLKLLLWRPSPPPVQDVDVPVRTSNLKALVSKDWDLAMQRVVEFVDDVSYVRRIAEDAGMDISIVKRCLRQLLHYGCIVMVGIFQYSNVYAATGQLPRFSQSPAVQAACLRYVLRGAQGGVPASASGLGVGGSPVLSASAAVLRGRTFSSASSSGFLKLHAAARTPSAATLYAILSSFGGGRRASDVFAHHNTHALDLDDRKIVTFGVVHGFIRRVHEYPVLTSPSIGTRAAVEDVTYRIRGLCDGRHSMDDLCCALSRSYDEIVLAIRSNPSFTIIRK